MKTEGMWSGWFHIRAMCVCAPRWAWGLAVFMLKMVIKVPKEFKPPGPELAKRGTLR